MTIEKTLAQMLALDFGLPLVCETFFYGCYTILFAASIYIIFHRPRRGTGVNKPIFIISGLLYLSCSAHFAILFSENYGIYATTRSTVNENDIAVGDLLISVTDFLGQLILIYRCWLLWSRKYWVIILPSLLSTASIVCYSVEIFRNMLRINRGLPAHDSPALVLAAYSLPLGTNVIVTTLITGRIWYLSPRKARKICSAYWQFPTGIGRAAIDIVIESGMLYFVVQLIFVISYASALLSLNIVTDISVQIYGIAATLIIIRAGLCEQSGSICSEPPSSMHFTVPTSSTPARMNTKPEHRVPAEMPVSEIKSKPTSEDQADQGSASSRIESVTTVMV